MNMGFLERYQALMLTMTVFSLSTLTMTVFYLSIEFAFFFSSVLRHHRTLYATKDVFKTKGNKDQIQKDASR